MTITETSPETTFNEGVAEARLQMGAEVRPIDEAMFGLRAVLRAGGQEYAIPDLWNRWHYPVGMHPAGVGIAEIKKSIVHAAHQMVERFTNEFQSSSRDRYYIIRHAWDQVRLWDFKRQVAQLVENDIRRHKPGIRKNNKEFKRLVQLVFAEAQMAILKQMADNLTRQIGTLKIHLEADKGGTIAQDASGLAKSGAYLRSVAADISILNPGDPAICQLTVLAERYEKLADDMLVPVQTALTDMERVWTLIGGIQVELAKVDQHRRAWFRTLQECDNRGLKGIGRKHFEEEAACALQKAEALQLVVDKMLRTENLLTEEGGMTCAG
jgi:hypothetical protein